MQFPPGFPPPPPQGGQPAFAMPQPQQQPPFALPQPPAAQVGFGRPPQPAPFPPNGFAQPQPQFVAQPQPAPFPPNGFAAPTPQFVAQPQPAQQAMPWAGALTPDFFSGLDNATVSQSGTYLPPGFSGLLQIQRTVCQNFPNSGLAFIVEFVIVESNLPQHPPGSPCSWYRGMQNPMYAWPDLLAFLAAACGFDPRNKEAVKQIQPQLKTIASQCANSPDANPLIGRRVYDETRSKSTRQGKVVTVHGFRPA